VVSIVTKEYVTIPELARLLGLSRITVYKRVRKGLIPATRVGRTYIITDRIVGDILGRRITKTAMRRIDAAVRRAVSEYGEVLKRLGKE
jgi:excisionase family DNA binding protein